MHSELVVKGVNGKPETPGHKLIETHVGKRQWTNMQNNRESERAVAPAVVSNVGVQRMRGTPIPEAQHAVVTDTAEVERLVDVAGDTACLEERVTRHDA